MKYVAAKIHELGDLARMAADHRAAGHRVALCHGVFDLVHVGHVRHFFEARSHADVLFVTVTPDRFVNKGPGRPFFTETLRAENLAALAPVDAVAVNEWPTAVETLALIKPDVYVKGSEYRHAERDLTGKIGDEAEAVLAYGGRIVFTDDITFSSSSLVNRNMPLHSPELVSFLDRFREKHSFATLKSLFDVVRNRRVLVVGETIIDEYQYCETLGKSGKEPILVARLLDAEIHAGGAAAIANHVAAFAGETRLLSQLGAADSREEFVRERLAVNVSARFVLSEGSPTIVKRRFVETYPFQKLFEVYQMQDEQSGADREAMLAALEVSLEGVDVVIVADYGHGLLEGEIIRRLENKASFLAINTQKNAGNHGFNTVSKYPRADFVSISEGELRLDARTKSRPLVDLIRDLSDRLTAARVIVTRGSLGAMCYARHGEAVGVPALTAQFRDRVGAGDAVFAVTALLANEGAAPEILGLVGNAAGAAAVASVGNRHSIDRVALMKHLDHLLK